MVGRIDVAWFSCPTCGHRSTPPDAINTIPHQMEVIAVVDPEVIAQDKADKASLANDSTPVSVDVVEAIEVTSDDIQTAQTQAETIKSDKEKKMTGNKVSIETTGDNIKRVKVDRSYSKVALQSHTELTESKHIILACPQCNTQLYEVSWK